jgi:biopolymer transport protein ExbB/TolQ
MTQLDQIRLLLHACAGLLVWPVIISLLLLAITMLVCVGSLAREGWERWRGSRRERAAVLQALEDLPFSGDADEYALQLEEVVQRAERSRWQTVNRLRLAVRVGPSLGLMGTLIPMADALQGLAEGNLPALASNMVTAFAATVIGLTISLIAYLLSAAREEWVRSDASAIAFQAERLLQRVAAPSASRVR